MTLASYTPVRRMANNSPSPNASSLTSGESNRFSIRMEKCISSRFAAVNSPRSSITSVSAGEHPACIAITANEETTIRKCVIMAHGIAISSSFLRSKDRDPLVKTANPSKETTRTAASPTIPTTTSNGCPKRRTVVEAKSSRRSAPSTSTPSKCRTTFWMSSSTRRSSQTCPSSRPVSPNSETC